MLTSQRKQKILDLLRRNGQVVAKDLSHELGLSEDTIRRDLREACCSGYTEARCPHPPLWETSPPASTWPRMRKA